MFTGLIQNTGILLSRSLAGGAGHLTVRTKDAITLPVPGESIAVNGACLTLEKATGCELVFFVMEESFSRTNLGSLPVGSQVNLERALRVGDRLGGHFVSGHVDAAAKVISLERTGADMELRVALPEELAPFLVEKGSIAIDGVSLTLVAVSDTDFAVRIIPTTWNDTALPSRAPGTEVNLETDMLGKYVCAMAGRAPKHVINMDDLRKAGF